MNIKLSITANAFLNNYSIHNLMKVWGKLSERNKLTVSIILFSTHEVEQSNLIRCTSKFNWLLKTLHFSFH